MNLFDDNKIKQEVDILLPLVQEIDNNLNNIESFKQATHIINNADNPTAVFSYIKQYYETGLLSPLTLHNDEFNFIGGLERTNSRCDYIIQNTNNDIIYTRAWKPNIVHVYDPIKGEEVPVFPDYIDLNCNGPLYITRGGCCTGEYIAEVLLKDSTVEKHCFIPHAPINIPVSVILNGDGNIFSVDCREPKLRTLRDYYNTREIKTNYKFDIRKFKKLNKNGYC